jgi:hypothetical protein
MCERWDKSRGLWVKLQETNYSVFVSGFLEDINAKQPYLFSGLNSWPFQIDGLPVGGG